MRASLRPAPPNTEQLIQKWPGSSPSDARSPIIPPSTPAPRPRLPSLSLSLLFSDSDFYISSKRTNGGTSITGSIGSSPSGNGLHPLAYRRKRKEAAEKGRSGVLLLLLLNPRGRRKRTIPLAPPASPRSEMRWLGWRRMADRALGSRVDLEGGEHVPSRSSSTSQSLLGTEGQAPENRCGPRGFCCCSCCRCGPTTPLRQAPWGCITISSLSL